MKKQITLPITIVIPELPNYHNFLITQFTNFLLPFLFLTFFSTASAQHTSFLERDSFLNKKRMTAATIGTAAFYSVSMVGLYQLWYTDYPFEQFHFFNDIDEWLMADKVGHSGSAYYLSRWSSGLFRWTGMKQKHAAWMGAGSAMLFLSTIEIFDGFSAGWGFSAGDFIANTGGASLFLLQELKWKEQRISSKFSYHETKFPKYRPELLGKKWNEKLFKDYNGQTHWLSFNIKSFLKEDSKFPAWLNIAAGYGGEEMISGDEEELLPQIAPDFDRYYQFYISPDIELTKIKTNSPALKTLFEILSFIKFPAPALEINERNKIKFHYLYF